MIILCVALFHRGQRGVFNFCELLGANRYLVNLLMSAGFISGNRACIWKSELAARLRGDVGIHVDFEQSRLEIRARIRVLRQLHRRKRQSTRLDKVHVEFVGIGSAGVRLIPSLQRVLSGKTERYSV